VPDQPGRLGGGSLVLGQRLGAGQAHEEEVGRDIERGRQAPEPGGGELVQAALVLLDLLEPHPDGVRQGRLAEAKIPPAPAKSTPDVDIDGK